MSLKKIYQAMTFKKLTNKDILRIWFDTYHMVRNTRLAVKKTDWHSTIHRILSNAFTRPKGKETVIQHLTDHTWIKRNYVSRKRIFLPSLEPRRCDTIVRCLVAVSCCGKRNLKWHFFSGWSNGSPPLGWDDAVLRSQP